MNIEDMKKALNEAYNKAGSNAYFGNGFNAGIKFHQKYIDEKINQLQEITNNFIFIDYYSHTGCKMYKIDNEFGSYKRNIIVLCPVSEGINKAIDLAIEHIGKSKIEFFNNI